MTTRARARIVTVVGGASLTLAVLAPGAHAQIGGVVGGVTDTVGGVTSGVTGGGSGGGGESSTGGSIGGAIGGTVGTITEPISGGNTSNNSDGSGGGLIGGVTEGIKKVVEKTKEEAQKTSNDLNNNVGETVGGVTNGVRETIGGTLNKVTEPLAGTPGAKKPSKKAGDKSPSAGPKSSSSTSGTAVMGSDLVGALRADARVIASGASSRTLEDAALTTSITATDNSLVERIGLIAQAAAEQMAFPALLLAIVIGFLMIQNRIDRRDPKLAMAPVDSEHDLLSFG